MNYFRKWCESGTPNVVWIAGKICLFFFYKKETLSFDLNYIFSVIKRILCTANVLDSTAHELCSLDKLKIGKHKLSCTSD
jgi:hypothetical protein